MNAIIIVNPAKRSNLRQFIILKCRYNSQEQLESHYGTKKHKKNDKVKRKNSNSTIDDASKKIDFIYVIPIRVHFVTNNQTLNHNFDMKPPKS